MIDLTSTLDQPWALVAWGGEVVGKRPRTRLAFLTKPSVENDRVIGARGHTLTPEGGVVKTATYFRNGQIYRRWTHKPSVQEVGRAKKNLAVTARVELT